MKSLLALTLIVACAGGCSLFGADGEAVINFSFFSQSEVNQQPDFRITYSDGRRTRSLGREDFSPLYTERYHAGPFDSATSGTLYVACSVLDERSEVLAIENVTLSLQPDWHHNVSCTVGQRNPYGYCFGCLGFKAKPLGRDLGFAEGDSLFVVWAGSSISSPVLY